MTGDDGTGRDKGSRLKIDAGFEVRAERCFLPVAAAAAA
jgi:hypothetical protein